MNNSSSTQQMLKHARVFNPTSPGYRKNKELKEDATSENSQFVLKQIASPLIKLQQNNPISVKISLKSIPKIQKINQNPEKISVKENIIRIKNTITEIDDPSIGEEKMQNARLKIRKGNFVNDVSPKNTSYLVNKELSFVNETSPKKMQTNKTIIKLHEPIKIASDHSTQNLHKQRSINITSAASKRNEFYGGNSQGGNNIANFSNNSQIQNVSIDLKQQNIPLSFNSGNKNQNLTIAFSIKKEIDVATLKNSFAFFANGEFLEDFKWVYFNANESEDQKEGVQDFLCLSQIKHNYVIAFKFSKKLPSAFEIHVLQDISSDIFDFCVWDHDQKLIFQRKTIENIIYIKSNKIKIKKLSPDMYQQRNFEPVLMFGGDPSEIKVKNQSRQQKNQSDKPQFKDTQP